ncbi:MAG: acyl-CoA ligase (AMP-forming), exosortase A system-associated [Candidatus Rokuibacteriota bacterium]|nr:MAG: acyl-CoA ligase (AMP-forming), exosortase A system-associated [Candidatus Rokubacteria bacterium]
MVYTVADILKRHHGGSVAEKPAVVDGQRRMTYAELLEQSLGYASLLQEAGLTRGDRVAIFLRRSVEAVIALFATYFAGGVAVIVNEALRPRQVNYILEHSQASLLLTDSRQMLYVPDPAIDRARIICVDETKALATVGSPPSTIGADLALIIYTSGSTGLPKGVMVSHANLVAGAQIVADYLGLSERDVLISLLPFSFDYGLNQLLGALLVGGTLVIQRSTFPPDVCNTLRREKVTGMAGVPTLWLQLTEDRSPFTRLAFPHLRYITNTGGRLPEPVVRRIRGTHPHVSVYLMYGLTEAFRSTYLPPDQVDGRPTSMGKAIPNVEILVVNDEGRLCGAGETGELVHRGATVAMGYWRDPESTAKAFRPHPLPAAGGGRVETVVFSGDLVKRDAEGYLYFVGRRDQLIKAQGFRVSPDEVEHWVFESDLVANVVAFAVSVNEVEQDIVIAVAPKDPATFSEERLAEFCKREMPQYLRPRDIWRLEAFPQTTSGKPDRVRIKRAYEEHHQRS